MLQTLTDLETLKSILAKHDASPKRSMGQNFLISPEVVEGTITAAKAGPKHVTELGPGIGTLTQALVASGFEIRAIEKDDVFARILAKQFPEVEVIHNDLKDVSWTWPNDFQIIGNIPYNLSGLIIRRITELNPAQVILLVQLEVAQRILATPPDMNLMALSVQLWGGAQLVMRVPKNCFWPQPEVDSALILLRPRSGALSYEKREEIMQLTKPLFQQKRKQIGGSLKRQRGLTATEVSEILQKIGAPETARPQELSAEQWQLLHGILTP